MQLSYSAAEQAFREEVRAFLRTDLPDDIRKKVLTNRPLAKDDIVRWTRILHARGWGAPNWPAEHGGTGWTPVQSYIFTDEAALAGAPEPIAFGVRMVAPVLLAYGTDEQKDRYLPRILSGDDWWCQGYSEPGAGSDLASLTTSAVRDGDVFVVSGQKIWTTYAQHADMMFCLVRTDPEARKQRGISFLLIDMRSPGITVRPIITLDGKHEVNEVFLDGVRVPASNLVGELHRGWDCAKYLLRHERFSTGMIGQIQRNLAQLVEFAAARPGPGGPLGEDLSFCERIARIGIEVDALEYTLLRALSEADGGGDVGTMASLFKIRSCQLLQQVSELRMDALGSDALAYPSEAREPEWRSGSVLPDDAPAQVANYLNLRKLTIYGGSEEVQKNILAKTELHL
ncbi:Acyl-CoA dehydrogenase, middle domain protein [Cupriavidus necator]|uniref:Acyl-CoA dehydrogenase, middle domain protein n=1 Tax=Cupriavidus necator TaxID=106590 RepID=A0A1K0IH43_CUPNE|nr:Acyl-CoA dehydrogenase, middle domain protein [Cupriavidus necator]